MHVATVGMQKLGQFKVLVLVGVRQALNNNSIEGNATLLVEKVLYMCLS